MRRWLILVIIRLHVILPHRVVLKTIPHQNPPQVRVPVEEHAVEVEHLALLKLRAAPQRRERRDPHRVRAARRALAEDDRPVLQRHRIEVIHRFEVAGALGLLHLLDLLLHAVHHLLDLHLLGQLRIEVINPRDVRAIVETELGVIAEKLGDGVGVLHIHGQRMLRARAVVLHDGELRARHSGLGTGFDLLKDFQRHGRNL